MRCCVSLRWSHLARSGERHRIDAYYRRLIELWSLYCGINPTTILHSYCSSMRNPKTATTTLSPATTTTTASPGFWGCWVGAACRAILPLTFPPSSDSATCGDDDVEAPCYSWTSSWTLCSTAAVAAVAVAVAIVAVAVVACRAQLAALGCLCSTEVFSNVLFCGVPRLVWSSSTCCCCCNAAAGSRASRYSCFCTWLRSNAYHWSLLSSTVPSPTLFERSYRLLCPSLSRSIIVASRSTWFDSVVDVDVVDSEDEQQHHPDGNYC